MTNKQRGNSFEREIVNLAKAAGFKAKRAYASNGLSLGEAETVDVLVEGIRVQAKRRKTLPSYLHIPGGCDVVVFKQDRHPPMVLLSLTDYFKLISNHGNKGDD